MKKTLTVFVSLLLLAAALGVSAVAVAPKPPKPPPPPPPAGTIYFQYDDGTGVAVWTMKADGSEKTKLPVDPCPEEYPSFGVVSRIKHGDHYWFVRACEIAGEYYPDGRVRKELFAVRDDNAGGLQLTGDPSLALPTVFIGWGIDDVTISWVAMRWVCDPDCHITEGGLYDATVSYDTGGNIIGLGTPSLILSSDIICTTFCRPSISYFDWSPDGSKVVLTRWGDSGPKIYVVDLASSSETYLSTGTSPQWSPDGSKIAFIAHPDLKTINPDGSGETTLVAGRTGKRSSWVSDLAWSPDGNHLVYEWVAEGRIGLQCDIYRIGVDGSGNTHLSEGYQHLAWR